MSKTPEALVRQWFDELWNEGREDAIDRLLAPHALVHGLPTPDGKPLVGPEAFRPFFKRFRGAFPDLHVTIDRVVRENDLVAAHCTVAGTHRGDTLGLKSTGLRVTFTGICIVRADGQQLVEGWNVFDFLSCFQQIRALPQLPA